MPDIFIIEHAPTGDVARSYSGMDLAVVEELVAADGNPYDVVDEATYEAKVAALRPVKP